MTHASWTVIAALTGAGLIAACGGAGEAERAFREGRFPDAHAAFAAATTDDDAPATLLHNRALAALRAGEIEDAQASAKRAAEAGDEEDVDARCAFILGNVAWARCETAEIQADTPEAEPFAFRVAIGYAESARDAWRTAATSREDWPEARRNVERALLKIEVLRRKMEEKEKAVKARSDPTPNPRMLPTPPDPGPSADEETGPEAQTVELSPEDVRRLLDRLAEKEREKIALRRKQRREGSTGVEKDW